MGQIMYLIITEDLELYKTDTLTDSLKEAADEGVYYLIQVSLPDPKEFYKGEWHDIPTFVHTEPPID